MLYSLLKNICTLGPIGYLPAPGTIASGLTLCILALFNRASVLSYLGIIGVIFAISIFAIRLTINSFADEDPSEIVIDEVVGMLITFIAIQLSTESLIVGLCLFRLFDITKIAGVRYFEQFKAPWGIMLDDMWAGILSNLIVHSLIALRLL